MRKITDEPTIVAWRAEQLLRVGVEPAQAAVLAQDPSVDLHALLELVDHSCPAHLAARILAPLEYEWSCNPVREQ